MGLSRNVSEINGDFSEIQSKNPLYLRPSEVFPLKFGNGAR